MNENSRIIDVVAHDRTRHKDLPPFGNQNFKHTIPASQLEIAPELSLLQLFDILRRRRLLILMITVLGTVLAGVAAMQIPPKYTAKAQIVVEPPPITVIGGLKGGVLPVDQMAVDTQATMLNARNFLRNVLTSLEGDGQFGAQSIKNGIIATIWHKLESLIGVSHRRPKAETRFEEFLKNLSVVQELRSRVITVRFTSKSPDEAAAAANRIVRLYVENSENRRGEYLQDQLNRLRGRIGEIDNTIADTRNEIRKLLHRKESAGDASSSEPKTEQLLRELNKEGDFYAQLHVNLRRRQHQLRDRLETTNPGVSILSLASRPVEPSSLSPILFILPAATIFFVVGALLAIFLDRTDQRLRSEQDINSALDIACIGLVPKLSRIGSLRPHRYLIKEPFSPYAEAVRSIVAAIQLKPVPHSPKVVMLTSSKAGEGKTTVAISLAAYAAHLGQRVLLVDLDFTHPSLLRELDGTAKRCVLDLLLSDYSPEKVIKNDPELGLDYLPMSCRPVDPVPLFANGALESVLSKLRSRYDLVVVDGPPILGGTTAALLASLVDKVLLVVKCGSTERNAAQSAIKELRGFSTGSRNISDYTSAIITEVRHS